ncbi:hypothetical protein VP1G_02248 [Cytospora mali]|uniref:Uncharacterized protein n=1 Tax=Cytospora mali TaxID=578113 RepID=A0A194UT35_CYTMA|nr:hypothetical protein VP1G_02248 [Valsa mali var. pyri (nom. inval.)]
MGAQQPYMYSAASFDDARFPATSFDPKAITRASWEPQKVKPKKDGPLVSFNRHPDAHEVRGPRAPFKTFGAKTKWWIKWIRVVQLGLRVLELIAAAGILFLFIIIDDVSALTAWVVRITSGVVIIHSVYGIAHLSRPAGARPPGSAAGYQIFASISDLAVLPLYSFGALSVHNSSAQWGTLLSNKSLMSYFLPSLYYTLIGGGVMHAMSVAIGFWLAVKFRQITRMPPDCNPLEDNLTSRQHKRNKSSVATASTFLTEDEKRLSSPFEDRRRSGLPYEDIDRPPAIPFHATRSSPRSSIGSASDLPPRQYHITPGNSPGQSPRTSVAAADFKRMSAPPSSSSSDKPPAPPPRSPWRGSYSGVPTQEVRDSYPPHAGAAGRIPASPRSHGHQSRPSTGTVASQQPAVMHTPPTTATPRAAKFTESWYATESLVNRTQDRNREVNAAGRAAEKRKTIQGYESLSRRYDLSDSDSESDYGDDENRGYSYRGLMGPDKDEVGENDGDLGSLHPNPLQSNPALPNGGFAEKPGRRPKTSFLRKSSALAEIDLNDGRVSNNKTEQKSGTDADITDEKPAPNYGGLKANFSKRYTWGGPRNRDSSIQPESDFYSKPYGDLKSATPPMIVGSNRQVSSGNDYDFSVAGGGAAAKRYFSFGKRNVSGKVAEEGRGIGWAR